MKRIAVLALLLIMLTGSLLFAQDDGQAPSITPIDQTETYYSGSPVTVSAVVLDQSAVRRVLLYYRFAKSGGYSFIPMDLDVDYSAEIPFDEVKAGTMQYYIFAEDIHGNQATWPLAGEDEPASLPIHGAMENPLSSDRISVHLVNPEAGAIGMEQYPIIVLSIYDPDKSVLSSEIRLFVDDVDITSKAVLSPDMVTYVPQKAFTVGKHTVNLKIIRNMNTIFTVNYDFTVGKAEPLAEALKKGREGKSLRQALNMSFNLGIDTDYDKFSGNKEQPDNRPIDTHKLSIGMKSRFWKIKFNASALLNTHIIDEQAMDLAERRQPLDRLKVDMRSPALDISYGDYSPEFSELTLKGTRVRGLSGQLRIPVSVLLIPKWFIPFDIWELGKLNISYVDGETKQLVDPLISSEYIDSTQYTLVTNALGDTTFVDHERGTATRYLQGLRTEFDLFNHLKFGVGGFRSWDNMSSLSLPYEELNDHYTFLGNIVGGADVTLHLNHDRTIFHGELAVSAVNDVMAGDSMLVNEAQLDTSLLNTAADFLGFRLTDDLVLGAAEGRGLSIPLPNPDSLDVADFLMNDVIKNGTYRLEMRTPLNLYFTRLDLNAEYKRVPANYVSLGNASIQTDIQSLKGNVRARFLKNILTLNGSYESKFDNVAGNTKPQTTNTLTTAGGFGLNIPHLPSVTYSIRIMDRLGELAEGQDESANIQLNDNQTITHTITPSYRFTLLKTDFSLSGNLMQMTYADKHSSDELNNDFITESYLGTMNLNFPNDMGVNIGLGRSSTDPEDLRQSSTVFDIYSGKLSFKNFNKKLNSYIGFNMVQGFKDGNGFWDSGEYFEENELTLNDTWDEGEYFEDAVEIDNAKFTLKFGTQYKINRQTSLGITVDHVTVSDNLDPMKEYQELRVKLKFKMIF